MSTLQFHQPTSKWDGKRRSGRPELTRRYFMWDSVWKLLANYLQPDSKISMNEVIARAAPFWDDTASESTGAVIHMVVTELAEQMPADHPSHKKLADFMIAMSEGEEWLPYSSVRYHKSLKSIQNLYWSVLERQFYNHPTIPEEHIEDGNDPMRYVGLQVFLAHVAFADTAPARNARWARWALNSACLEAEDHADDDAAATRDAWVMGGAQYILHAGASVWARVERARTTETELEALDGAGWVRRLCSRRRRRDLRSGREHHLSWSQWESWRIGFRAAALNEIYSDECRTMAWHAANVMARHDGSGRLSNAVDTDAADTDTVDTDTADT